ncbi:MAG: flagellar hook-basal body complex protein FliE [Synergistaceae bacterium]|jgi:flagellar hook-basal body complex protein FliE|nr:flagellar hook-basal body complex protein FliE [Synergistaceae bacterium]
MMLNMARFSSVDADAVSRAVVESWPVGVGEAPGAAKEARGVSFEEMLDASMKSVNALQLESDQMVNRLATGDVEDISEVVLASSRAEVALRMFMEIRNKFVDAYQQLSRMSA